MNIPSRQGQRPRPAKPLRGRIFVIIVLVVLFPLAARRWFDPAQAVALAAIVAAAVTALVQAQRPAQQ